MEAELMTLKDVAQYLRLNEKTISRLAQNGELPAQKLPRGWRFSRTAVDAWKASQSLSRRVVAPLPAKAGPPPPLTVAGVMDPGHMNLKLRGTTKDAVLHELVALVIDPENKRNAEIFFQALKAREDLCPTCVNEGVAIPHARNALVGLVDTALLAYGRHPAGIDFGAFDGKLVQHFFLLCAPTVREHLQLLSRLSRLLHSPDFRVKLNTAGSPDEVIAHIRAAEQLLPTA